MSRLRTAAKKHQIDTNAQLYARYDATKDTNANAPNSLTNR
jgi:hypothetical protein